MTPEQYFEVVLTHIESKSIKEWAASDRNRPFIFKAIETAMGRGTEPLRFATYLMCIAMGM